MWLINSSCIYKISGLLLESRIASSGVGWGDYQVIRLGRSGKESRNELLDKGLSYRWCVGQTWESLTHPKTVLHKSLSASTLYLCVVIKRQYRSFYEFRHLCLNLSSDVGSLCDPGQVTL